MRKGFNFIRLGRHGRLMKDGEPTGGATPDAGGDNGGGNSGDPANPGGESNNDGQTFDAEAFWKGSGDGDGTAPSGESAQSGDDGESGSQEGGSLQDALTSRLDAMTFGDPVFTADIAEQINEGNFEGVEARIQGQMRNAVRNSMSVMVQILKPFAAELESRMGQKLNETFSTRDNATTLETMFPAAKNPAVRPAIQGIYDQALKNNKGNREKAVAQTKEMMRFMAGATADDLDVSVAPRGADDSGRPASPIDWLEELTAR